MLGSYFDSCNKHITYIEIWRKFHTTFNRTLVLLSPILEFMIFTVLNTWATMGRLCEMLLQRNNNHERIYRWNVDSKISRTPLSYINNALSNGLGYGKWFIKPYMFLATSCFCANTNDLILSIWRGFLMNLTFFIGPGINFKCHCFVR